MTTCTTCDIIRMKIRKGATTMTKKYTVINEGIEVFKGTMKECKEYCIAHWLMTYTNEGWVMTFDAMIV